jgi:NAD(P)-dependent dehydrogenase (short-subunit alcohol dehydrogenase family)
MGRVVKVVSQAKEKNMSKRVAIITDAVEHLGPDLARKLAQRSHNLVLGGASDELASELRELGAEVEVVAEVKNGQDLIRVDAVPSLIARAISAFGGFNAAFIRPGTHVMGDMFSATAEDMQAAFEGNMLSTFHALNALVPALIEQGKGGQILVCSSATAIKPYTGGYAYTATRAGAIMLVRTAAQSAAPHGITINGIGTMFLNYAGFLDNSGCRDPEILERTLGNIPVGRLGEPHEPAHIAAAMLDGESNFINGEFISVSGGWTST